MAVWRPSVLFCTKALGLSDRWGQITRERQICAFNDCIPQLTLDAHVLRSLAPPALRPIPPDGYLGGLGSVPQ